MYNAWKKQVLPDTTRIYYIDTWFLSQNLPYYQPETLTSLTMCPRWQGPDKTHAHMHPAWAPRVLGSDPWQRTRGRPSAKVFEFWAQILGIIPQAGPLPKDSSPNSNPSHLQPLPTP